MSPVVRPGETTIVTAPTRTPVARLVSARLGRPTLNPRVTGNPDALATGRPTTVLTPRPGLDLDSSGPAPVAGAKTYPQAEAKAVWHWTHNLGRIPRVEVYVLDTDTDVLELADVVNVQADNTEFTITFSQPVSGLAVVS